MMRLDYDLTPNFSKDTMFLEDDVREVNSPVDLTSFVSGGSFLS